MNLASSPSPEPSPRATDERAFLPIEQDGQHQQILPRTRVISPPTRQASTTTRDLAPFSEMRISPHSKRNTSQGGDRHSIRQLPVPWGARSLNGKKDDINIDLLRAASSGNLVEVRRLHLTGVDVLASGNFENGGSKSALFAAADAIKTCFEDIQRSFPQPGPGRDILWRDIMAKTEVIRYLRFHGATLDRMDPILKADVERALRGPPVAGVTEQRVHTSGGYRPIAAANPQVKLAPIGKADEPRRDSSITTSLSRLRGDPQGGRSS